MGTTMNNSCPVCHTVGLTRYSAEDWKVYGQMYTLAKCTACGCAFTSPMPDSAALKRLYSTAFDYRWYRDHYDAKLRDCRQRIMELRPVLGSRVLDYGGGVGYFSEAAREAGFFSVTYDPYVGGADVPALASWDAVVALHVLEHSNDLDATVARIKEFLVPGGRAIVAVPNFSGLGYRQQGMSWVWAQPPLMHIFHFTATGLKAIFSRHGFTNLEISYHERWDANRYCDVEHVEEFRVWDREWCKLPYNLIPFLRRRIARRNSDYRYEGLQRVLQHTDTHDDSLAELQISCVLGTQ